MSFGKRSVAHEVRAREGVEEIECIRGLRQKIILEALGTLVVVSVVGGGGEVY